MSEIKDYAIKCFQDEAQAILDLIPLLTDDFDKAIDLIYHSRGKLVVTGVGKSGHCGARLQLLWPVLEHLPFLLILWMLFMVIWA